MRSSILLRYFCLKLEMGRRIFRWLIHAQMDDPHRWLTVLLERLDGGSLCTCGGCAKALTEFPPLQSAKAHANSPYRAPDALLFLILEVRKYHCIGKYLVKVLVQKLEQNELEEDMTNAIQPTELILSYATIEFQTFGLELIVEIMNSKYQRLVALAVDNLWYLLLQPKDPVSLCHRLVKAGIVPIISKLFESQNLELMGHTFGLFITILYGLEEEAKLEIIDSGIVQQVISLINSTPVGPETRVVVCKAVDVIGWLACGGKQCQDKLVALDVIQCFLSLLECNDKVVVKSTWMALNWVIYCAEGKKRFLEGQGLEKVIKEFKQSAGLTSSGVVFATRKLAQVPDIRSKLLQLGVLDCLIQINIGSNDRMKYVTSLAMSFVCLDVSIENKEIVEKSKALDYIVESVKFVDPRRDLNILYNDLKDARTLLVSTSVEIQCFGLWWLHHLLVCEDMQIYKRKVYKEMVVRDDIIVPLCQILKQYSDKQARDLNDRELLRLELAASTIYFLTKNSYSKNALIEAGIFTRLLKILMHFKALQLVGASPSNSPKLKKSQLSISWDNAIEKLNQVKNQEQMQQFIAEFYTSTAMRHRIKIKIGDCLHHMTAEYLENIMDLKPVSRDGINRTGDDKNQVKSLFMLCENFIFSNLDEQNAIEVLEFADFHEFDRLKLATTTFVIKTPAAQEELSKEDHKQTKDYIDLVNSTYLRTITAYEEDFCQPLEVDADEEQSEDGY